MHATIVKQVARLSMIFATAEAKTEDGESAEAISSNPQADQWNL
jgi:hypothetical protein